MSKPSNPSIHPEALLESYVVYDGEVPGEGLVRGDSITLRDLFAGFALAGMIADRADGLDVKDTAKWAYSHADAMLDEREKREP